MLDSRIKFSNLNEEWQWRWPEISVATNSIGATHGKKIVTNETLGDNDGSKEHVWLIEILLNDGFEFSNFNEEWQ